MKKFGVLDRYLLKDLTVSSIFCQMVLSILVSIVFSMKAVSSGYSLGIVIPWLGDSLLYSLYFTVPLSVMAGCTLSYGRFVADREYTASVASGISPIRLFLPMFLLVAPVMLGLLLTQSTLLPELQHRKQDLSRFFIKQLENIGDGRKGQIPLDEQGGVIYWEEIRKGTDMSMVYIEKQLDAQGGSAIPSLADIDEKPPTTILADRAKLSIAENKAVIRLTLRDVQVMYPVNRSEDGTRDLLNWDHEKINFDQFNVDFPINSSKRRQNYLPTADLISLMDGKKSELDTVEAMLNVPSDPDTKRALQSEKKALTRSLRRGDTEIWRRRAMALAVLSFALLGSPLALLLRTNQRLVPFFFAVLAVLAVFYPLTYGGIQLSRATGAPAWITVLSGNYALILVSLGLIFRLRLR